MPVDVAGSVNKTADKITSLAGVDTILRNPLLLAGIMTIIIMLITLTVFRNVSSDNSLITLVLRSGFWSMLILITGLFLNNRVMLEERTTKTKSGAYDELFNYDSPNATPLSINFNGL